MQLSVVLRIVQTCAGYSRFAAVCNGPGVDACDMRMCTLAGLCRVVLDMVYIKQSFFKPESAKCDTTLLPS